MRLCSMIAAAATLVLTVATSAQELSLTRDTLLFPVPGAPLSVDTMEKRVTKNSDGTSTTQVEKTTAYRDAAGRMRTEIESPDDFGDPLQVVILADPVDGFMAFLETSKKIAHRAKLPKASSPVTIYWGSDGKELADVPGKKTRKTENLGKKTLESIEFEGLRTTTTSDDHPSLVAVDEWWMSKELGLIGSHSYLGPDGEITARIQNPDRKAPDPALFVIPNDYHIREMEVGAPAQ